jgi:hypothetical protein
MRAALAEARIGYILPVCNTSAKLNIGDINPCGSPLPLAGEG